MGVSDPFPSGYVIWFGSLEFRATGYGYLMELLSCNPDAPVAQPQQRSKSCLDSPTWVEAGVSRADA
jgi:hypothetical protein